MLWREGCRGRLGTLRQDFLLQQTANERVLWGSQTCILCTFVEMPEHPFHLYAYLGTHMTLHHITAA